MVPATASQWDALDRWSPTLFLVGGGLLAGHAAMLGVQAFSNLTTPPDVFGPAGHLVALVGLLGLYPGLVDRLPMTARAAGGVATVAAASWAVVTVTRLLGIVGVVPRLGDLLPGAFFMVLFVATVLTYVLFAVATSRVQEGPRSVGLLVLAPGVLLVVVLVDSAVTGVSGREGFVVGAGLALSMFALAYTVRTWDGPTGQTELTGDVTAG